MHSAEDLRLLSDLLDQALELPVAQRQVWMQALQGDAARLGPTLERMLSQECLRETDDWLAHGPVFTAVGDVPAEASAFKPGQAIGPYRLIRELGRGGMGEVWLAERADGQLKRSVALKLPTLGLHRAVLAERFARERDILASLVHPNIARLYDAGVSPEGQSFMALEYVQGTTLTRYCAEQRLGVSAKLGLFLQVLAAVQYAHSLQVVHRDLKPSNILVGADGAVRLLDFGIAKLLHDGLDTVSEATRVGGGAYTPQYASPEQVAGQAVGPGADVYALGVLLYELLTGQRPYRLTRESRAALEEAILLAEPDPPSARVAVGGEVPGRPASLPSRRRELRGDLDAIVLKALKKSPSQRYASALAFSEDLVRHLQGIPVLARPDHALYRLGRLLRRHRVAASALSAVLLALIGGLSTTLWQYRLAQQRANDAQREARASQAVQAFMEDIFRANSANAADPVRARQATAAELLDAATQRVGTDLTEAPEVKLRLIDTLLSLQRDLGRHAAQIQLAELGLKLARQSQGEASAAVAERLLVLSEALQDGARLSEAGQAAEQARSRLDRLGVPDGLLRGKLELRLGNLARNGFAVAGSEQDHLARAVALLRPFGPSYELSEALYGWADHLGGSGDHVRSKQAIEEAIACCQSVPGTRIRLPALYAALSRTREATMDFPGMVQALEQAFEVAIRLHETYPRAALWAGADLAFVYGASSRLADGLKVLEEHEFLAHANQLQPPTDNSFYVMRHHAQLLLNYGRTEQALSVIAQALRLTAGSSINPTLVRDGHEVQTGVLLAMGRTEAAGAELELADRLSRDAGDDAWPTRLRSLKLHAQLAVAEGKPAEARRAFSAYEPGRPGSGRYLRRWLVQQLTNAEIALDLGEFAQAAGVAQGILERLEKEPSRRFFALSEAQAQFLVGAAQRGLGQPDRALNSLAQSHLLYRGLVDIGASPAFGLVEIELAQAELDAHRPDRAARWLEQARALRAHHAEMPQSWDRALQAALSRAQTRQAAR